MEPFFDFDEIRPFHDEELPEVIRSIAREKGFEHAVRCIIPDIDYAEFCQLMYSCRTKKEFQIKLALPLLYKLIQVSSSGIDGSGFDKISTDGNYTYMSNHRDIVLDASFLNVMLHENRFDTCEVAIGDNLLIYDWIANLVRVNKSVIVNRNVPVRKMLEVSKRLSNYIRYTIQEKHQSLWIAQREGRAKDSDDRTQESMIKMFNLGGTGTLKENIMSLNIVPVSISYEYDPCDYLKAQEFQQKRDNPDFKKTPHDDLLNMEKGILGYKGHIHFALSEPINEQIAALSDDLDKTDTITRITHIIDRAIHSNYMIYTGNYVAYDLLYGNNRFTDRYSEEEKAFFNNYVQGQIDKITDLPDKDEVFLRHKILEMYSNPLKNKLIATGQPL
ncbi:MAG: acyltransferase [Coprobacter sp.]|nr:acyltransferase [Coprobacter sp.]